MSVVQGDVVLAVAFVRVCVVAAAVVVAVVVVVAAVVF